jgi:hypothetical protein
MEWSITVVVVLVIKFLIYAAFANVLNLWFGKAENKYIVSGVRMLLSLLLTGLNALLGGMLSLSAAYSWMAPFVLAPIFALLAWYIVIRIFYASQYTSVMGKALLMGTLLSIAVGIVVAFLSFIGLMSTINFC